MDTNTMILIVVGLFVVVAIIGMLIYRGRNSLDIRGPGGTGVRMDGSNDPPTGQTGVRGHDITSAKGGIKMHDRTGQGVDAQQVKAELDVDLTAETPPTASPNTDPKS